MHTFNPSYVNKVCYIAASFIFEMYCVCILIVLLLSTYSNKSFVFNISILTLYCVVTF